jgi:hypothetical protein
MDKDRDMDRDMDMDIEEARTSMHEAIDTIFNSLSGQRTTRDGENAEPLVTLIGDHPNFHHVWPDGVDESFRDAHIYRVGDYPYDVVLGWTNRAAWGRLRSRAVVFRVIGGDRYPWAEFVETDDDRYSAGVFDPRRPRAQVADGQPLPQRFDRRNVHRTDDLYESVRSGPSMRVAVNREDEVEMVSHAYWVAQIRNNLRPR